MAGPVAPDLENNNRQHSGISLGNVNEDEPNYFDRPVGRVGGRRITLRAIIIGALGFIVLVTLFLSSIRTLKQEEQVLVEAHGVKTVQNGPGTIFVNPFATTELRLATLLDPLQYAVVKDVLTGVSRCEPGPKLVFLGPHDTMVRVAPKIALLQDEYVRLVDRKAGTVRVLRGPEAIVPEPTEVTEPEGIQKAVPLTKHESVRIRDSSTGQVRTVRGEKLVFPGPFEVLEPKTRGIRLSKHDWVRVVDEATGAMKVIIGEQMVFLGPTEKVVGADVNKGVKVDRNSAVLVLSKETGQQRLVTEQGVFIPGPYEEILEVRSRIHVEPHEAVIIRDDTGKFGFYNGAEGTGSGTSFFLAPYNKLVTMDWSAGPAEASQQVTKIDLRSQSMTFDVEVRTADNVKLRLKGIIFWRLMDVPRMIRATSDPKGAVWHRARSVLIQAVSKEKLAAFMNSFNTIVTEAFETQAKDAFYEERGVEVQSMEVTSFECVDAETAQVLQNIIRETTERINKLQAQESENEVRAAKLAADVALEKQAGDVRAAEVDANLLVEKRRLEFLKIKAENDNLEASVRGKAAGLSMSNKAATFMDGLKTSLPNTSDRLELYKLQEQLQAKNEDTRNLASGKAQLFLTPQDVNLKLSM